MNPINFQRVNDRAYRFTTIRDEGLHQEVFLNIHGQSTAEAFRTSKVISQYLIKNKDYLSKNDDVYFEINKKVYKYRIANLARSEQFANYIASFFKYYKNPSKVEILITPEPAFSRFRKAPPVVKLPLADLDTMEMPKIELPTNDSTAAAFLDGYTKLATEAFQKYEQEFAQHDYLLAKSDHSQYRIVQNGDRLELVHHNKYSQSEDGSTLHCYRDFLFKEYGREKIEYIAHHYRIDLNAKAPLTPEIVYRINIGVGNLEKQDLEQLITKFDELSSLHTDKTSFDMRWLDRFTTQELRGIKALCAKGEELTAEKMETWLSAYKKLSPQEKLKLAVSMLTFQPEERARQFTGRDIVYPIKGCYILADNAFYKPWVDQQELLHTFDNIQASFKMQTKEKIWDYYYEILSHVICKKHLARQHPEENYRVGAIIPAPPGQSNEPRWYVITSCISNGKGIHDYTLEPLDPTDLTLPVIKLFRSTSSKPYAIDGRSTVRNDLNPINSPGYEGAELIKKYQDDFFKQRTIPLWVAYNQQAAKTLEQRSDPRSRLEVQKNLYHAIESYKDDRELANKISGLSTIVKKHDSDLLQLANNLLNKSIFNFFKVWKIIRIIYRNKNTKISQKAEKEDSRYLLSLLQYEDVKFQGLKQSLKRKLSDHTQYSIEESKIHKITHQLLGLFVDGRYDELIKELNMLAHKKGELPHQKIKQSVLFVGHSLGGACSQKFLVDYTAKSGRVPLEGMEFGVRSFDSPAINREDNRLYADFGKHQMLFQKMGLKFSIVHRFEAGDFVSQSGGEHLGAAADERGRKELQSWTKFETTVSEGLKTSAIKEIRDFNTAHATQFENGKRKPTFIIETAKKMLNSPNVDDQTKQKIAKIVRDRLGDYERTWIDPQVLWSFNNGDERNWSHIQGTWHEPGWLSTTMESMRSTLGVILRMIFIGNALNKPVEMQEDVGHGDWWKYRDENGVFAVSLAKGIISVHAI